MDLSLEVRRFDDRSEVVVVGEVDLTTADELKQTLTGAAEGVDVVVADLAALEFLDSTGLSVLLAVHKTMRERGGRLELRDCPAMLVKMVGIVGLDDVFSMTTS